MMSAVSNWGFSENLVVLPTAKQETVAAPRVRVHCTLIIRNDQNRFLLMHFLKKTEKKWRFTGGKPFPGESLLAAAAREMKEETGLEPLNLALHCVREQKIDGEIWRGYYFLCDRFLGAPVIMEPDKHDKISWLSATAIAEMDTPDMEREITALLDVK